MSIEKEISFKDAAFIMGRRVILTKLEDIVEEINSIEFDDDSEKLQYLSSRVNDFILEINDRYNGIVIRTGVNISTFKTENVLVEGSEIKINDIVENEN